MTFIPIYIFAGICVLAMALWIWRRTRTGVERFAPVLGLVANVAALTVFVSLYWTAIQDRRSKEATARTERLRFNARMASLVSEIHMNKICSQKILENKESHLKGITSPENQFILINTEEALRSGELTYNLLRNELRNAYQRMALVNRLMTWNMELFGLQTLVDQEKQRVITVRVKENNVGIVDMTTEIKERLDALDKPLWYFMEKPEYYGENVTLGRPSNPPD